MIPRSIALTLALGLLAACETTPQDTGVDQQSPQQDLGATFGFSIRADALGPSAADPIEEAARLKELERQLRGNRMCPNGYVVISRRAIIQIGEKDQVEYQGRCAT